MNNRHKFLGFNPLMFGDLVMNTVAARALKEEHPDSELVLAVNKNYADIAPIFFNHPNIDKIYITHKDKDGFDEEDIKWINHNKFSHVFNPMQDHNHGQPWFRLRKQPEEVCYMHGLKIPNNSKCELIKWFDSIDHRDVVAFSPFPAFYAGIKNDKAFRIEKAQKIVNFINSLGYKVMQVGHPSEPELENVIKPKNSFFDAIKNVTGCKAWIGGDTGMCWLLSAYNFPVLACYSNFYYTKEFVKNIQPINPNAIYLDDFTVNDINDELIFENIKKLLS